MISSLKKPESEQNYNHGLIRASTKPCKTYSEANIRLLVDGLLEKNIADMTQRKAKQEEKLILKQLDMNEKEVEKGNENMHNELQRETLLSENDLKLLQGEASKDEKCFEKEIGTIRKQKKKQPEETEKDQRRRERKESKLKEKLSLQNQVSFMERFLKRSKSSHSIQNDQFSTKSAACDLSISKSENVCVSATLSMDCTLASSSDITLEDIRKSHFSSWRCLGKSIRLKRNQGWGLRRKPKSELFKELKLAVNTGITHHDNLALDKHVDGLGEHNSDVSSSPINADRSHSDARKCYQMKQLLQFDNCHRPAFYGIWSNKRLASDLVSYNSTCSFQVRNPDPNSKHALLGSVLPRLYDLLQNLAVMCNGFVLLYFN
ncbi:hypothetical protein SESBI_22803 [Sesbania bispinosa]|nr:hypothetical protein SESBI_22803 [Sesbania bispinosa]